MIAHAPLNLADLIVKVSKKLSLMISISGHTTLVCCYHLTPVVNQYSGNAIGHNSLRLSNCLVNRVSILEDYRYNVL